MNPDTNRFEPLSEMLICYKCGAKNQPHYKRCLSYGTPQSISSALQDITSKLSQLVRPDGSPVPEHWAVFKQGEHVVLKNYTFKVGYIGDAVLVLEPVGPYVVGDSSNHYCRCDGPSVYDSRTLTSPTEEFCGKCGMPKQ